MTISSEGLTISIVGAAGKMGTRALDNLSKHSYKLLPCEKNPAGIEKIQAGGFPVVPAEKAIPRSDVVVFAVPDVLIKSISANLVPLMRTDSTCILLDPAAAYLGEVALRDDCTFVVSHPCHPALFAEQDSLEALKDHFGGTLAKQDIVVALLQGEEAKLQTVETLCMQMFGQVLNCHRITVEQMALLEPAAAEVIGGSAICILREAMDELVSRGVPEKAARAFMLGHIQVISAVLFDQTEFPVSDAAKVAFGIGKEYLVKPDWKRVFEPETVRKTIQRMIRPKIITD
jgi:hypothetical protein